MTVRSQPPSPVKDSGTEEKLSALESPGLGGHRMASSQHALWVPCSQYPSP